MCDHFGHAKCAGIIGRAADAVLDPSKGLRWSCPDCRKRDIDFYKLFTETRNCFSDLSKHLGSSWEKLEIIKTRFDKCRYIPQSSSSPANKVSTRSAACGSSHLSSPKSLSSVQVSDSLKSTRNVSVFATVDSVGNIKVTKKPGSSSGLSYAEGAGVSPPIDVTQSSQASSPKTNNDNSKSSSPPGCSSVNPGRQIGHVSHDRASVVTPSIFSPNHNSPSVNPAAPSTDDVCLKAVPPRKATFVSRLAPAYLELSHLLKI
ncbi:uncharacterized protein ACN2A1_013383 [Glossina fuscipes fuscipes]